MKGHRHLAWNALAALLAVACIVTSVAWAVSFPREIKAEFSHGGKQWEAACRSGVLWLDNQPQQRLESAQFNARTADLQRTLHDAWGTDPWRRRAAEMHRLEQEQARTGTPPKEFRIPLLTASAILALLPAAWMIIWLFRNPFKRGPRLRLVAVASAGLSLVLFAMMTFMWLRSYFTTDRIIAPTTWRLNRVVLGNRGMLVQSFLAVRRTETWEFPLSRISGRRVVRPRPVLIGAPADAPMPFEQTEYAERLGSDKITPNRHQWGKWEWEAFNPDRFTYTQLAWTRLTPTLYPRIEPQYFADTSYANGNANLQRQVIEEQVFVGHYLWLPYWVLVAATLVWPALVARALFKHLRRERWRSSNRCCRCGYDLRATQGVCPECGTVPAG